MALHRLVYRLHVGERALGRNVLDEIGSPNVLPRAEFMFALTVQLRRKGLVCIELFALLVEEFPMLQAKIRAMEHALTLPTAAARAPLPQHQPESPFAPFASFVGRERELKRVRDYLYEGRSALLIAGRRAGKTALISQLGDIGRRVLLLDAAAWELTDAVSVYRALGEALGCMCSSRRELEVLLEQHMPLALVLDEADRLLGWPWTHSLFSWLRYLQDKRFRHTLSFLLVGGPELWRYRNPDDRMSPPLNTSERIFLEPLSVSARGALIDKLAQPLDRGALLAETGGHPWLLNAVLGRMWDGAPLEEALDQVAEEGLNHFATWQRQLGDEGIALVRRLQKGDVSLAALKRKGSLHRRHGADWPILRCLCLARSDADPVRLEPGMFVDWLLEEG